jgi:predicted glycosyltransferase involved in capsule biosynthesis
MLGVYCFRHSAIYSRENSLLFLRGCCYEALVPMLFLDLGNSYRKNVRTFSWYPVVAFNALISARIFKNWKKKETFVLMLLRRNGGG